MTARKRTPDILGTLLKETGAGRFWPETVSPLNELIGTPEAIDILPAFASVLGYRSVDRRVKAENASKNDKSTVAEAILLTSFEHSVAVWAKEHLKARQTTPHYLATGLMHSYPYSVDVWAHFNGGHFRSYFDMWVECKDQVLPVNRNDISALMLKAIDVFCAAHAQRQDFWFDRLMIVSTAEFDSDALALANDYGVVCVHYAGTNYLIQTNENWQQKPKWIIKAEETLESLQR
ncbi:MAG: hypothetical protein SVM79_05010 [Chloroflexota bacterium]|nr:hypothetical protein [Chloroflexota bacterium]